MPLPTIQQIRTLAQWSPLLGFARRWSAEPNANRKGEILADALEWAASQTAGRIDDQLAQHIAAVLRTHEGAALVRLLLELAAQMEATS
jgi:hypothetical protein